MKRVGIMAAAIFICAQGGAAFAAWGDGPGCGLGKMLWEKEPKSIMMQVFGATTNGTFGSQTFGISSGTSGCTNNGMIVKDQQVNVFAAINFENLSQEMAQGHGEHLASLAALLGVPAEHHAEFFAMAQERYTALIQSGETTPAAMLTALHSAMTTHPVLVKLTH
ncbi:DUF3015 domain-containing protein [Candidatus Nitrospira bockiana]